VKKCPQCGREYDTSMMFCLDDGAELLYGPATADEPATAILQTTDAARDAPTRAQLHTIERTAVLQSDVAEVSRPNRFDKRVWLAPIALSVIVLGGFFSYRYFNSVSTNGTISSIAVLPFENRSGNADSEYLSDGLAESLIYRLSQIPDLKVSPTSSVFRYKGKETDPQVMARELGVDSIMTGRITARGDSLTISVNLVDTRSGKSLWGEQYERKLSDLLATQREIAAEITNKLQLKLSGAGEQKLAKSYTDNNEAYQLYLKGRFFWNKRDEENLRKAIEQFRAAADKDPHFALALVGLADSYSVLPYYSTDASSDVLPQAKVFATRALEIDNSLGEAHASLGYVHFQLWNWSEAEKSFVRAIDLNPGYGSAHRWYAQLLQSLGRHDEAEKGYKRAVELEPVSLVAHNNLAELYYRKGDVSAAGSQFQRAIELDPNWYFARMNLAQLLSNQGRNVEAVAEAEKSVELSKRQNIPLGILGYVYARAGRKGDALQIVEELKERYQKQQAGGLDLARVFTGLNDKDQAFVWLEKEFQSRNQKMPIWFGIGIFDPLRDDPRYGDLLKRMNLPE
jgi:TolB-like protein/Flp pilus assembly protein TadD